MAIGVKTNVSSLMAQRHLNSTNRSLAGNIAKLSSGFRINSAADDAAGLAVSEEMKAGIRSLGQASRNANDAISVIQTAEGSLGEMHNILGRMRELSVQANSDGINNDQRAHLHTEFDQLRTELTEIAERTEFNGNTLLDGTAEFSFQVGVNGTDTVTIEIDDAFDADGLNLDTHDLSTTAGAVAAMADIDAAITSVSGERASLGAMQNRLESKLDNLEVSRQNLEAANSRIRDVDIASEMADMTKNQILMQAGTSMLAQANSLPQTALSLLG